MCGIAGVVALRNEARVDLRCIAQAMAHSLSHRGPDHSGVWSESNVALAHTRLAIVGLDDSGNQPLVSESGRYVLSFNGEIYNHKQLRKRLEASPGQFVWRGSSDTETLLKLICVYGVEQTLELIDGMFAFSLLDRKDRTITLARDRIGEKPLYYGVFDGYFAFGSELKVFKRLPEWHLELCRRGTKKYFQYGYVPAPFSIIKNVRKLTPGSLITLSIDDVCASGSEKEKSYWNVKTHIYSNVASSNYDCIKKELKLNLESSILQTLDVDVPIGAFLSGGYDSSLIAGYAAKLHNGHLKTFSIGFEDARFDESKYARSVAKFLKTDHFELTIKPEDVADLVLHLPRIYDEPFSDSSQIPTSLLAKFASSEVKVALSGDGGDELFGGYTRYTVGSDIWRSIRLVPVWFRRAALAPILHSSATFISEANPQFAGRLSKLADTVSSKSALDFYSKLISNFNSGENYLKYPKINSNNEFEFDFEFIDTAAIADNMMWADLQQYLPDDILVKIDRPSMFNGLETRVPFLSKDIVEFALNVPLEHKCKGKRQKMLIKDLAHDLIDKDLLSRPKMGFGVPLGDWLRGPLRAWATEIITNVKNNSIDVLDMQQVHKSWSRFLAGEDRLKYEIWSLIMFLSWYDNFSGTE